MSYAHNDHYKWIEENYNITCSPLGKEVANIIGFIGGGIYNAPCNVEKVDWNNNIRIELNWGKSLANYDGQQLTDLVIECHRRMIRVSIEPNMRYIRMTFHQRITRSFEASISKRMPDIETMISMRDSAFGVINDN
jgi:hypothetical protein